MWFLPTIVTIIGILSICLIYSPIESVYSSISTDDDSPSMLETMTIGLQIGLDKYDSGQYEQALNQVEKILFVEENFPSDTLKSVALALGGLASLNLGQYDKAISYFNSALEIDSTLALSQSRDLAINLQREDDLEYEEEETEIPCIENPQCRDRANFDIQNARNALELPTLDLSR